MDVAQVGSICEWCWACSLVFLPPIKRQSSFDSLRLSSGLRWIQLIVMAWWEAIDCCFSFVTFGCAVLSARTAIDHFHCNCLHVLRSKFAFQLSLFLLLILEVRWKITPSEHDQQSMITKAIPQLISSITSPPKMKSFRGRVHVSNINDRPIKCTLSRAICGRFSRKEIFN